MVNCCVGIAAVMLSLILFLPLEVVCIVIGSVIIIYVLLLGWMKMVGLPLSLATSLTMTMAIGFAIDYASDISMAFQKATGSNADRASLACLTMAKPIFTGGMSTILACVPLIFALSPVGKIFGVMVIGIVVVGIFVGCVVLPVAMATFARSKAAPSKFSI